MQRDPHKRHGGDSQEQSYVSKTNVDFFEVRNAVFADTAALFVFLGGKHRLKL